MSSNKNEYKSLLPKDDFLTALKKSFGNEVDTANEIPIAKDSSELPESFDDAVDRAAKLCMSVISSGSLKLRIDFDTSVGDQTYTSLKNTIPMSRLLTQNFANLLC